MSNHRDHTGIAREDRCLFGVVLDQPEFDPVPVTVHRAICTPVDSTAGSIDERNTA